MGCATLHSRSVVCSRARPPAQVTQVRPGHTVTCQVLVGGALGERKVAHISGVTVHSMNSSMQDFADIQSFAVQHGVDYVAASQVRSRSDIDGLRSFLDESGGERIRILAKVETAEGLRNFDGILDAADGVMLARGNLGLSIAPEKVPLAQAAITAKCKVSRRCALRSCTHTAFRLSPRPLAPESRITSAS
jgi:pyruvate kinase